MVWRYVEKELPTNLAWIHAAVCEKLEFTGRRRMDGGRLRHDSSSADKVKQLKKRSKLSTEQTGPASCTWLKFVEFCIFQYFIQLTASDFG